MTTGVIEENDQDFYSNGANYWSEIPATIDGMLGGFGFISQTDIKGSKILLKQLFNSKHPPGRKYALDCGAGIGRITKFLLTDLFEKVDLVEQNPIFLQQAKRYIGPKCSKIGDCYSIGLQDYHPEPEKYDVIWIQWVIGHLTNSDLINFLISCRRGLKPNGMIIVKENITSSDDIEMDRQDSSVTRPLCLMRQIFDKANLECHRQSKQHNFPKGLYSVYMFALKPKEICDISDNLNNSDESIMGRRNSIENDEISSNFIDKNLQRQQDFGHYSITNSNLEKITSNTKINLS